MTVHTALGAVVAVLEEKNGSEQAGLIRLDLWVGAGLGRGYLADSEGVRHGKGAEAVQDILLIRYWKPEVTFVNKHSSSAWFKFVLRQILAHSGGSDSCFLRRRA